MSYWPEIRTFQFEGPLYTHKVTVEVQQNGDWMPSSVVRTVKPGVKLDPRKPNFTPLSFIRQMRDEIQLKLDIIDHNRPSEHY